METYDPYMTPYALYWVLFIVIAILSHSVQANLDRKFKKYSQIPTRDGLSGHDVATRMLADHGLTDVRVTCVEGRLSDHYNPETNTVNLSKDVYYGRTMMAAAVAAHECGHAVQHRPFPGHPQIYGQLYGCRVLVLWQWNRHWQNDDLFSSGCHIDQ